MQAGNDKKIFESTGVIIVWLTLILQLVLIIYNRGDASVPVIIVRYFSFYTILTNILVAIAFTSLRGFFGEKWKNFFSDASNFTAVTVYIMVVSITYNLVLRGLVKLEGLQRIVDELLHLIIPIFVFIYWLSYVATKSAAIHWKDIWKWQLYPLLYCIYILIRGSFSNEYPYPFMNVDKLGYSKVIINCIYVTLAFLIVSFLLVGYVKFRNRRLVT